MRWRKRTISHGLAWTMPVFLLGGCENSGGTIDIIQASIALILGIIEVST